MSARRLRELIAAKGPPVIIPGAPNALTARVVQEAGFDAVYLSGASLSNTYLGKPDIGLVTLNDLVGHVAAIADAVEIPLLVDGDTGFGNAHNVQRSIRLVERAGAAGMQIEDQVTPKRCGHFADTEVISAEEMVGKVHAAVDARMDDDFVVVARTDALGSETPELVVERMLRYREAGADVLFIEAPQSIEEMRYLLECVPGVHIANMVEGGLTPLLSREELRSATDWCCMRTPRCVVGSSACAT
jgi:2-methylisocitrate lyase-like PEP mutase family enzyme